MTLIVRDGDAIARTITAIQVRDGGNVARDISEIRVRDSNNVSRLVFTTASPLTASASPEAVGGVAYGDGNVTTNATTVTPAGGTAPYTYAWTVVSYTNGSGPPVANSPTAAITTITQTGVIEDDSAVLRCTVTDDNGATATADVSAFFINTLP